MFRTKASEGAPIVDLGGIQELIGIGGEVLPIIKMGRGQTVNVIGHPDGVGPVPAKGSKRQWSHAPWASMGIGTGATFRAGLLLVAVVVVVVPWLTAAVQRKLVLRDVTFVKVGRISRSCTATVRQAMMPPGVGAAGAASHGGDEKMRLVFVR